MNLECGVLQSLATYCLMWGWCVGRNPSLALVISCFLYFGLFLRVLCCLSYFRLIHLLVGADMESLLDNKSRERILDYSPFICLSVLDWSCSAVL